MRTLNVAIACATLLIAGVLFWPTLYRYDRLTAGGVSVPLRAHRVTGDTEIFWQGAWQKTPFSGAPNVDGAQAVEERFPESERALVTGDGAFGYSGQSYRTTGFGVSLYNGSKWTLSRVVFRISAREKDGSTRWSRQFDRPVTIQPLTTQYVHIELGGDDGAQAHWSVDEAFGSRPK